ncbi:MAG TPA: outer membrane protein assembly factor BamD [Methylomirabilota bacterium]|nr:outer membrane protein assembly factor BamD [Methylomirabilota bacterium]
MSLTFQTSALTTGGQSMADPWPMRRKFLPVSLALASLLLLQSGCTTITDFFRQRPQPLPPASDLYAEGETALNKGRFDEARTAFRKVTERHPQSSYAARSRFLIGEAFYREGQWDKAIKEFEGFMAFYPRHEIADLVQFRLAMSYYDQMKPVEQDQEITRKAMEAFRLLVREYPESRYAADALAKIDICRGRLAQKELWVASYYLNQGNPGAARPRLEKVVKEYPRTLVMPEALFRLGEVYAGDGRADDSQRMFRQLADEYPYTEWGRRAAQRIQTATR